MKYDKITQTATNVHDLRINNSKLRSSNYGRQFTVSIVSMAELQCNYRISLDVMIFYKMLFCCRFRLKYLHYCCSWELKSVFGLVGKTSCIFYWINELRHWLPLQNRFVLTCVISLKSLTIFLLYPISINYTVIY